MESDCAHTAKPTKAGFAQRRINPHCGELVDFHLRRQHSSGPASELGVLYKSAAIDCSRDDFFRRKIKKMAMGCRRGCSFRGCEPGVKRKRCALAGLEPGGVLWIVWARPKKTKYQFSAWVARGNFASGPGSSRGVGCFAQHK